MFDPTTLLAIAVFSNLVVNLTLAWRDLRIVGRNYKVWDQERTFYEAKIRVLESNEKFLTRELSLSGKHPAYLIGPCGISVVTKDEYDMLGKVDHEDKD